jgi:uncharacterized protein YbaR (Trm112 family)
MCSICIDDFEEGEKLRLLPNCGHAFHTDCILPWLTQRQGCCPYCKTPVALVSEEEEDTSSMISPEITTDTTTTTNTNNTSNNSDGSNVDADADADADADSNDVENQNQTQHSSALRDRAVIGWHLY